MKPDDFELGWLSALIDGEGGFCLYKCRDKHVKRGWFWSARLVIANTNLALLERAKKILGVGCINIVKGRNIRWKPEYTLTVGAARTLQPVLEIITPYLIAKKQQGLLLLEATDLIVRRYTTGYYDNQYHHRLEQIQDEIKKLNKKGIEENV